MFKLREFLVAIFIIWIFPFLVFVQILIIDYEMKNPWFERTLWWHMSDAFRWITCIAIIGIIRNYFSKKSTFLEREIAYSFPILVFSGKMLMYNILGSNNAYPSWIWYGVSLAFLILFLIVFFINFKSKK